MDKEVFESLRKIIVLINTTSKEEQDLCFNGMKILEDSAPKLKNIN